MRFSEFAGFYRKTRIGKCLKIKSGQDQKSVCCEDGKYFIYGTGGIIGTTNSFLYDKESVGIGRKGTIDKPFYFNSPFWTVDTLFYSVIFSGFSPRYIYYLFQTINWKKYNSSTGVPSLTSSTIESIEVYVPSLEEQQTIAYFLALIDKRIETQNKIIEKYKSLIKYICYTTEVDEGNNLSNIAKYSSSNIKESDVNNTGTYPVFGASGICGFLDSYSFSKEGVAIVKDGAGVGRLIRITNLRYSVLGTMGLVEAKEGIPLDFLWLSLKKINFNRYVVGSGIPHIYYNDYKYSFVPALTSDNKNRAGICRLLLDKIQGEEEILTKYAKQKKFLLNNLFI